MAAPPQWRKFRVISNPQSQYVILFIGEIRHVRPVQRCGRNSVWRGGSVHGGGLQRVPAHGRRWPAGKDEAAGSLAREQIKEFE
jgi:hypothetical protein